MVIVIVSPCWWSNGLRGTLNFGALRHVADPAHPTRVELDAIRKTIELYQGILGRTDRASTRKHLMTASVLEPAYTRGSRDTAPGELSPRLSLRRAKTAPPEPTPADARVSSAVVHAAASCRPGRASADGGAHAAHPARLLPFRDDERHRRPPVITRKRSQRLRRSSCSGPGRRADSPCVELRIWWLEIDRVSRVSSYSKVRLAGVADACATVSGIARNSPARSTSRGALLQIAAARSAAERPSATSSNKGTSRRWIMVSTIFDYQK
jgi:hypothetical protein